MLHVIMIGWGYDTEDCLLETTDRNEAIEYYEELHLEWFEKWNEGAIESSRAQSERPFHLVWSEDEGCVEF